IYTLSLHDALPISQGIVTLKDIVSNLMGPVTGEEKDNQSPRIIPREDGSLIVDGRYQLVDFFMELKMPLTEEQEFQFRNTTTLGGLVFALFGRVPKKGEVIEFGILKFERSEEHTSELQSRFKLVCRLLLEKKKQASHELSLTASPATHTSFTLSLHDALPIFAIN